MKKRLLKIVLAAITAAMLCGVSVGTASTALPVYADESEDDEDDKEDSNEEEHHEEYHGEESGPDYNDDDDDDPAPDYYDDDEDDHRQEHWDDVPTHEDYYAYVFAHIHDNTITVGSSTIAYVDIQTNASQASLSVSWSSSNPSVASVSGNGNNAGVTGVHEGYAVITATLYMEGQYADAESISVKVNKKKPSHVSVDGINISDTYVNIAKGESRQIAAYVTPGNASDKGVSWSSTNNSVVTVDSDGTLHGISSGQATVYARSNENGFYRGCNVTVHGGGTAAVQQVSVNPTAVTLAINQYMYITPTVYPQNAKDTSVSWSSSNSGIASVSHDGKVMGRAPGQAVITCRSNDGGKTATTVVTVGNAVAGQTAPVVANNTRSPQFCYQVVQLILGAAPNATVMLPTTQVMAYDVNVAAAMNMRPDVSLECTFAFQGHNFDLLLPKGYGTKLASHCDKQGYVEWLQLCTLTDGPQCRQLN